MQRPVRVVLTRPQMYALGYRPAMIQRIALGCNADGALDVITHDAVTVTSQYEDFYRRRTGWSGLLYKSANAKYTHRLARARSPHRLRHARARRCHRAVSQSPQWRAAVVRKVDPIELRLRCYSDRNQHGDRSYSSKALH